MCNARGEPSWRVGDQVSLEFSEDHYEIVKYDPDAALKGIIVCKYALSLEFLYEKLNSRMKILSEVPQKLLDIASRRCQLLIESVSRKDFHERGGNANGVDEKWIYCVHLEELGDMVRHNGGSIPWFCSVHAKTLVCDKCVSSHSISRSYMCTVIAV